MIFKRETYRKGHLTVKFKQQFPSGVTASGLQPLKLGNKKENLIYIPTSYHPGNPASLAVMLHGAGGTAAHGMSLLQGYADANNIILIAPASQDYSWDIIADNSFGHDVMLIDEVLEYVFNHFVLRPEKIAVGGFSDGASYALCTGLSNGDVFTHIIAFSPGFSYTAESRGTPKVFISHGTRDHILPINPCSRRIVPALERKGIVVMYHEFDGEHIIPPDIAQTAVDWFLGGKQH